jgi:hypothetical protein
MSIWVIPSFLSVGGALLLGGLLFGKRANNPIFVPLIVVMLVVAWTQGLNALSALFPESLLLAKQFILLGELAFPIGLGYVNYRFLQHLAPTFIDKTQKKFLLIGTGAIILSLWLAVWPESVLQQAPNGDIVFPRSVGWIMWGFILLALVVGLSQLEQILRAARDPRYPVVPARWSPTGAVVAL